MKHKLERKYKRRLLKLADFLDTLPRKQFNLRKVGDCDAYAIECGSTACAVGWCPRVFPGLWGAGYRNYKLQVGNYISIARKLFSLRECEAEMLFTPEVSTVKPLRWLRDASGPAQVAQNIRTFVENFNEIRTRAIKDDNASSQVLGQQVYPRKYPLTDRP